MFWGFRLGAPAWKVSKLFTLKTGTWPDLSKPVPVDSQPSALDYTPHALRKQPLG